jgi:hypothetical protein
VLAEGAAAALLAQALLLAVLAGHDRSARTPNPRIQIAAAGYDTANLGT